MPKVLEASTGKTYDLSSEQAAKLLQQEGYSLAEGEHLTVKTDEGITGAVSEADYGTQVARGARPETSEELAEAREQAAIEEEHGGVIGGIGVGLETAVDTAFLGAPSAIRRAIAPEYHKERVRARKAHEGLATGVEIATAVGTGVLTGGAGTAASLAKLTPYGRAAVAADKLTKSGKAIKGTLLRGGVEGAGAANQAMMLSEDPLTLERAVSQLGTGALLGAAVDFGTGVTGKALGKGLQKARRPLTPAKGEGVISSASEEGFAVVEDLRNYNASDIDVIGVVSGPNKKVMVGQRGAKGRYAKLLDDSIGLAERPSGMLKPLRKDAQILRDSIDNADDLLAKGASKDARLAKQLGARKSNTVRGELANAYGDFAGRKITRASAKEGVEVSAKKLDAFRAALESGEVAARRAETVKRLPELLEANEAIQQRVLGVIEAGRAAPKGFVENAATGAAFMAGSGAAAGVLPEEAGFLAPLAGAAAAGKVSNLVFGRMGNASAAAAKRTNDAIDLFLKGGKTARRITVPAATRVLNQASFGEAPKEKGVKEPPKNALYKAYQAREKELHNQVMATPEGLQLKPAAREKVFNSLSGVRALAPQMADAIETQTAKKVTFLAEKLPKRPDYVAMRLGPDTWRPSDMAMREFARYVAAITDPQGVFERVADGTVTPEDGESIREVYPEQFQDFQEQIIARLPELRAQLPYDKRLALSIFTGVPVDPAMDPRVLGVLQGHFVEEPGEGNQAPKANPQFGSISKEEPTSAQRR